jgi:hypothetical protein
MFATAPRGYIIHAHVGDARAERLVKATYEGRFAQGWFERGVLKTVALPEDALDTSSPSECPRS